MTRLVGKRITLREYLPSDALHIYRWRNDPNTTLWMGPRFRTGATMAVVEESLARVIESPAGDRLFYAIARNDSLDYIGGIDLTTIDKVDRSAVLSIVVGSEVDRNQGYAGEAIGLLLRHAFEELGLHRISLNVCEKNPAAVQCYIKSGFRVEGRRREQVFVAGEYSDLIQMGILESEYRKT